jgi:hypothetical protein
MIADELRRQADQFVDIVELQPRISRDATERAARETREPRHFLQRGEQRAALLQMAQVWQRLADEQPGSVTVQTRARFMGVKFRWGTFRAATDPS